VVSKTVIRSGRIASILSSSWKSTWRKNILPHFNARKQDVIVLVLKGGSVRETWWSTWRKLMAFECLSRDWETAVQSFFPLKCPYLIFHSFQCVPCFLGLTFSFVSWGRVKFSYLGMFFPWVFWFCLLETGTGWGLPSCCRCLFNTDVSKVV
jgi:hypothetical protein